MHHSTLGWRVTKKKKKRCVGFGDRVLSFFSALLQINFVDFDSIDRIVGVSPCHPQARTGVAILIRTDEQWVASGSGYFSALFRVRASGQTAQTSVRCFRLVIKAHRLVHHSTLGWKVMKTKKKRCFGFGVRVLAYFSTLFRVRASGYFSALLWVRGSYFSALFRVRSSGLGVTIGCKVWSSQGFGLINLRTQGLVTPGFRVQGSGFRFQGWGFRVQGSGCRVQGAGFRVQGSGFRVQGSGFRVQGSGFRVQGKRFREEWATATSNTMRQIVYFTCLDLYYKPTDSGERQNKSSKYKRRCGPVIRAGSRRRASLRGGGGRRKRRRRRGVRVVHATPMFLPPPRPYHVSAPS